MRVESNIKPPALAVEKCAGDIAEVIFRENITAEKRNEGTVYSYDEYRTAVPYRSNLLSIVKQSKATWLKRAIIEEKEAAICKPTLEEQVIDLAKENIRLRDESDVIGAALEEIIALILGGIE